MQEITRERLMQLLCYDEVTGVFTNRIHRGGRNKAGERSGTKTEFGHVRINISGKPYFAHRLAWLWVHGSWPCNVIDHINGIPDDNRMSNLRDVTHSVNLQNLKRPQGGNPYLGTTFSRGRWLVSINRDRVRLSLGSYDTPEEARDVYLAAKNLSMDEFKAEAMKRSKKSRAIERLVQLIEEFPGFDVQEEDKAKWLSRRDEIREYVMPRRKSEAKIN